MEFVHRGGTGKITSVGLNITTGEGWVVRLSVLIAVVANTLQVKPGPMIRRCRRTQRQWWWVSVTLNLLPEAKLLDDRSWLSLQYRMT